MRLRTLLGAAAVASMAVLAIAAPASAGRSYNRVPFNPAAEVTLPDVAGR